MDAFDLIAYPFDGVRVDAVLTVPHQALSGELQEDAPVFWRRWHDRVPFYLNVAYQ